MVNRANGASMRKQFTSTEDGRLDKVISDQTKLSRKRARKVVEAGGVRVNGKKAKFSSQFVAAGSTIAFQSSTPTTTEFTVDICYKDEAVVVVNKPCGLASQPMKDGRRSHLHGLVQAELGYAGLHHRLDTPASGLMLFTLHKRYNAAIADAFRTHSIQRIYQCVVVGELTQAGTWSQDIDGKAAVTHYTPLARAEGMSLIQATLQTGRTHQIRVHSAHAGHPIVGDRRHGGAAGSLWPRLALHAAELHFDHPETGKHITVKAPIPQDLASLWLRMDPDHLCTPTTATD